MRMRSKPSILMKAASVFLVLLLATGCGAFDSGVAKEYAAGNAEAEDEEELITVGFSQLGSESVWRSANTESVKNAFTRQNGFLLEFNNARQKQENQIKAIRGFISQRVDYIVFSPVTETGWETVLQEARSAGIPVILVDRKISSPNENLYTTWVGTDARAEGEKAGLWLEQYLVGKNISSKPINIVVLQGTTGSSAQLGRTMGFDSIADRHGNWNILAQQSADFTAAKGKEVMSEFLKKYDDIDVVISQNDDMTFGALDAMKEAGVTSGENGDIILISFDAVHEALELVQQGIINVDVECNPDQGEYIMDVIRRIERGEHVEKENVVEEHVFTKDNVNEYIDSRTY